MAPSDRSISAKALEGVIVVELGARIGGAVCSSLLAQLGAKVIVFETRSDFEKFDKSQHRRQLCAGKLSLAPNLNDDADRLLVRDIITRSNILLTSSDYDPAAFLELIPARSGRQVFCDITAFGQSKPASVGPLADAEVQALVGITHTTGYDNGPPAPISIPVMEYLTGMHAAGAVLAALYAVQQGAPSQSIDMALYDAGFAAMSSFLTHNLAGGDSVAMARIGNRHSLSAPWNVYRAVDGWVQICTGSDLQWRRFCSLMECPELADDKRYEKSSGRVANVQEVDAIVQSWIQKQTVDGCVEALSAANIPGGPIAVIDGYPREANLSHRNMVVSTPGSSDKPFYLPGSPFKMSRTAGVALTDIPSIDGDRSTIKNLIEKLSISQDTAAAKAKSSLAGLRVIEIGHYTTAPVAARYLASLGADVIKIEPPEGEASRSWPPLQDGQSLFYTLSNSDKRSITLDLNTSDGKQCLRSLLETADILIENLKPGALSNRGFSPAEIEEINPRLIYCAISGFGSDSLYSGRPAFDTVVQAMSGLMDLIKPGDAPLKTGISIADLMGAAVSVVAIVAAINWRHGSGLGQFIDLSMQDVLSWSTQLAWNGCTAGHDAWAVAQCADGYALSSAGNAETASSTRASFVEQCISRGHRAVAINTPYEALVAEQTSARKLWFQLRDHRGTWPAFATPLRLLGTPCEVKRAAPALGYHNEEIIGAQDRTRQGTKRSSDIGLAQG